MYKDNLKLSDIFWNTLGSVTFSIVSIVLSIVVINLCGKIEGGIFSFGFSTLAHLVFIFSYFGIRPMHIVDIKYKYKFKEYLNFGKTTTLIGIILALVYVFTMYILGKSSLSKVLILFCLILHGAMNGISDYYECEYQRVNKLSLSGQSLFIRITSFALTLVVLIYYLNNLIISLAFSLLIEFFIFYLMNVIRCKKYFDFSIDNNDIYINMKSLFTDSFPLFLIVFLDMYIFMSSKFAIDFNLTDIDNGYFNLIFMPTNAIYLVLNLFIKPLLTPLSNYYHGSRKEYNKLLLKVIFIALGISSIFILGTVVFSEYYNSLIMILTGNVYYEYKNITDSLLLLIIIGGGLYSLSAPMYYALIIENKQKYLVISYVFSSLCALFVSNYFVRCFGIKGAAISYVANMGIVLISILIVKGLTNLHE